MLSNVPSAFNLDRSSGARDQGALIVTILEPALAKWLIKNKEVQPPLLPISDAQFAKVIMFGSTFGISRDEKNNTGELSGQSWIKDLDTKFPGKATDAKKESLVHVKRFAKELNLLLPADYKLTWGDLYRTTVISKLCAELTFRSSKANSSWREFKYSHAFPRTNLFFTWYTITRNSWLLGLQKISYYREKGWFTEGNADSNGLSFYSIVPNADKTYPGDSLLTIMDFKDDRIYSLDTCLDLGVFPQLLRGPSTITIKKGVSDSDYIGACKYFLQLVAELWHKGNKAINNQTDINMIWNADVLEANKKAIWKLETTVKRCSRAIGNHVSGRSGPTIGRQTIPKGISATAMLS
jgi:hypothetical protein